MNIRELLILHHSHMDIGYTHPQPVVWELHDRCIDEAIDLCETTAGYPEGSRVKWTCEVTNVVMHWLQSASQAQLERMRKLVSNGQMSFGAMLCHWTALHPEDLLQQSLRPMKTLRDTLGAQFDIAMQTDVNGVPWSNPDLLLDAGVSKWMMSVNIHMGGYPLTRPAIFRWQAPSGREVTVYSGEQYNTFSRVARLEQASPSLAAMDEGLQRYFHRLASRGWSHDFAILTATHPMMDDNGPPNPELPEAVRRWNAAGKTPFIRIISLRELADKIDTIDPQSLPLHSGDWTDFWSNGVGASALDVVMSRRAHGALWGSKALATRLPQTAQQALAARLAIPSNMLHLANEHTWNSYASTAALGVAGCGVIEPIPEAEQRLHKSNQCAGALTHARLERRLALDTLAGNPSQSRHQDALLVFNPSECERTVCLRLTPELAAGAFHLIEGTKHRLDVTGEVLREASSAAWFGPVRIPPLSLKTIPLADLAKRVYQPAGVTATTGRITSPFWELCYDPASGAVHSLVHQPSGKSCYDAGSGFDLFGAVQETVAEPSAMSQAIRDPRFDFYQASEANYDQVVHSDICAWATAWQARHLRPEATALVEAFIDAEGAHLTRWLSMPGVTGEMKQTISLLAHEDRVRFEAYFNKADHLDPESLYFTFPFACANAQTHFDTAGVAVAYDQQQLPGACRDWFTAGSYVAIAGNDDGCLTLACPDAPLFQLGGFHYARRLRDVSHLNQALVMAWPTNNYWNTNFRASQPGFLRLRYELTWTPRFDAAASSRFAAAMARPPVFHPVVAMTAVTPDATLLSGLGPHTTVVALEPADDGSLIVGLRNHGASAEFAAPAVPGQSLTEITHLNALQEDVAALPVDRPVELPARQTTWLRLSFTTPAPI